ncbi:Cell division coordinator CpoB OS=Stutzerimonas stutzeri OX=316 GN=ygbF PE=3 SV=1 [Stutzerimonas stutzeri]
MLFQQLQQMQEEIAQLRGMLEEQQNQIQRLQQEGLERLPRFLIVAWPVVSLVVPRQVRPIADAGQSASGSSVAPNAPAPSGDPAGDPAKEKLYYDTASI